ncbi:phosphoglycerate kinase [Blattabacterium cuenoti]|uniref:phosphoglycerate kinase n=1 Tax=Blattabacterium cuenoti TaxID=1653831 RepID=UPI00293BEF32|nr:phosphoglycerate kinase [Blattabacterium cuenoti]
MMIANIKTINDFDFKNKIALVRVDFNVPIKINEKMKCEIMDDTRILLSLPTINKIISDNGKIIIITHIGRPKGIRSENLSTRFLVPFLSKKLKVSVKFSENCIGKTVENEISLLKNREILLLENIRFYKEEENDDKNFSFNLSKLGDIYVNDAFAVSHRLHASVHTTPKFFNKKKCIGFLMKKEIHSLKKILGKGEKPITILLGGAKISSKIAIIENLINKVDNILIGGGMAYPFIKAKGGEVGDSLIKNECKYVEKTITNILNYLKFKEKRTKIFFPEDVIITTMNHNHHSNSSPKNIKIVPIHSIPFGWVGLDIGPSTIKTFCKKIKKSKTILWNGPLGVFEKKDFSLGTKSIAKTIIETTKEGSFSLIGGGDTIASLKNIKKRKTDISYLSTGGGAMLEFLKNKIIPGIKSISLE